MFGGCGPYFPYFEVSEIQSLSHQRLNGPFNLPDSTRMPFSEYNGMFVQFGVQYLAMASGTVLPGVVYARDCAPNGDRGAKSESIEHIWIITLNDFDANHLAGDTINDYFSVGLNQNLAEFLDENRNALLRSDWLHLKLNRKPELDPNFKVKLVIQLQPGKLLSRQSATVVFE